MSTTVVRFIEVRDKETGKWHLVQYLVPYSKESWHSTEAMEKYKVVDENGKEWRKTYDYYDNACSLRDAYLSNRGWRTQDFSSRGFPTDMSDELNEIVTAHDAEVKAEQEKEMEHQKESGTNLPQWMFSDYWYNKSYVTLSELEDLFDKEMKDWKTRVLKMQTMITTNEKMREILSILKKEEYKPDEDQYTDEDLNALFDEDLWDILSIQRECYYISKTVDEVMGIYNDDDIRMVYYFE